MVAHRDAVRFGFFAADHGHVGNFLHLGVANLGLELFIAVVEMRAEAGGVQLAGRLAARTR